ncbi:MAG: 50S ribosomal protein L21 [Anaerolineaceae bacterium]|jgi:large subunit ribosomal protein L21|nr:MAG: 50S ribosomal protein L21 [Anaerolineaceae bacterium]
MLYAIFESGGKQFKAVEGSYIEVDHLPVDAGKKISFDKVLLLVNEKDTQVGTPFIKGASVDATVITHFKAKKVIIFNYRPKKRYRVKTGHRQQYTRLMVNSIAFTGKAKSTVEEKPAEKVEEKKSSESKVVSSPKPTTTKKTTATAAKASNKSAVAAKAEKK